MFDECDSLTSRHKITLDRLIDWLIVCQPISMLSGEPINFDSMAGAQLIL